MESFTLEKVTELRSNITQLEKEVTNLTASELANSSSSDVERVREMADTVAKSFLVLEKYVNINFMGFHKILKKHDKNSPSHACKQFYINRMHNQAWVRGDYSDVVVRLSAVYSALRNDHAAEENKDASQSFLRSTTKYWVRTEDVSKVKYAILKHLPVFLQKTSTGESDSQLTNSVYFDNDQLGEYFISYHAYVHVCIAAFCLYGIKSFITSISPFSQSHIFASLTSLQSSTMVDLIRHRVQLPTGYVGMVRVIPRLSSSNERHIGIRGRERLV